MLGNRHTLHAHQSHHGWDNSQPPVLTLAPGETVEFEVNDASGGRVKPDTTLAMRDSLSLPLRWSGTQESHLLRRADKTSRDPFCWHVGPVLVQR